MRFTVIYQNIPDRRRQAINLVSQAIAQNVDLSITPINHPVCKVVGRWPDSQTLLNLPISMQCEEIEYVDKDFKTLRLQVIDVEVIVEKEPVKEPEVKLEVKPEGT